MNKVKRRNDPDVLKLAAEAKCDPRSAARVLSGEKVKPLTQERIETAAKKLKMKLPAATP